MSSFLFKWDLFFVLYLENAEPVEEMSEEKGKDPFDEIIEGRLN